MDVKLLQQCAALTPSPPKPEVFNALARFRLPWLTRGGLGMSAPGFLDSMSPWTSRSATPKPGQPTLDKGPLNVHGSPQQGGDHHVSQRHRLSLRDYPEDCPPLNVRWFYAVDVSWILTTTCCCLPDMSQFSLGTEAETSFTKPVYRRGEASHATEEVRCLLV